MEMNNNSEKNIIVVGAGLAGLSCAIELIELGYKPLVLEGREYVGGRTASFYQDGMHIETGLHRYLGFYTYLPKMLRKAGLSLRDVIFWEDSVDMRFPNGPRAIYHASVHRPVRSLLSFIGNNHYLNWSEKLQIARLFGFGLRDYFIRPSYLKEVTVEDYAKKYNLSDGAYEKAIRALCEGIFFTPPKEYAMYNLMGLIGPYLFKLWKFRIGGFRGGMTDVMCGPLADYISSKGGVVRTAACVDELIYNGERIKGVKLESGEELMADTVVLACALDATQKLTARHFSDLMWCKNLQKLKTVPVVTLHIEMSGAALPHNITTFGPTTDVVTFAEQSRTTFSESKGRLSVILSAPERFLNTATKDLSSMAVKQLLSLGIDISDKILNVQKVVLPKDFYSLDVGMDRLRPSQLTGVRGLYLAGDYTRQKYLGTMEGAVYSGILAAKYIK